MNAKIVFAFLIGFSSVCFGAQCQGHFVNPVKDICWKCLFPLSIGHNRIVKSANGLYDTKNPRRITNQCGSRIGMQIGYWEPFALVDVTDTPYCMVNLGGFKLSKSIRQGGRLQTGNATRQGFYHVHWYKYPLMHWLNLLTDLGCQEGGDLDVMWMTELDPSWEDSSLAMISHPDAALFANPVAQMACAADSSSSSTLKKPLDNLFWCAGSQGSHYPLTGHITSPQSPVQMAFLLAQRLNFKLHRFFMITDSVGIDGRTCSPIHYPVTPKSRYRYELVNQVADGTHCYPSGYSSLLLETGKIKPNQMDQYGFLVWRKRNCTFL